MQLLAKFKKILYMGFRATLNFRKIKVALNPMYRMFLNFAKSCINIAIFLWLTLTLAKNGRQSINSLKVMVDYVQALENCVRPP